MMSADASGLASSNAYLPALNVTPGRPKWPLNVRYSRRSGLRDGDVDADSVVTVPAARTRPRNAPHALSTTLRLNMILPPAESPTVASPVMFDAGKRCN